MGQVLYIIEVFSQKNFVSTLRFQYLLNIAAQTIKYAVNTTQPSISQCPERTIIKLVSQS